MLHNAPSIDCLPESTSVETDQQIITKTLEGNSDAFGELVVKYQDKLFAELRRFGVAEVEIDDIMQKTFLQAYLKLDTFRQHCAFYTWLHQIAFHFVVSAARRKRLVQIGTLCEGAVDHHRAPPEEAISKEQIFIIYKAMRELSDECREVLDERSFNKRRYDEIANKLGIKIGTVRSRLHRARQELRDKLKIRGVPV